MQDEIRRNTKDGSSSNTDDEENCALEIKERKGKGKISNSKSDSYHGGKKKDMTKVKCSSQDGTLCYKLSIEEVQGEVLRRSNR